MRYMSMLQFKSLARKEPKLKLADEVLVCKLSSVGVELTEKDHVRFTITTNGVDRDKDTINLDGWDLNNFKKNPVVLWGHESREPPIGKAVDIFRDTDSMKSDVDFVPGEIPIYGPKAQAIKQMCKAGFLFATSVGFRPLEFKVADDRDDGESWFPPLNFLKQELMEFSIVSIPANPEALIEPPSWFAPAAAEDPKVVALEIERLRRKRMARMLSLYG